MSEMPEYDRGFNDARKAAVTWLHEYAKRMNDGHARSVINMAADHLGSSVRPRKQREEAD